MHNTHDFAPFPYNYHNPVPVLTPGELTDYCEKRPGYLIAFYLGDKDEQAWGRSTSRFHMNDELLPGVIYLPIQIENGDIDGLKTVYRAAMAYNNVIFINHAAPYKSNAVMKRVAQNPEADGDYFVRNDDIGTFSIEDGNGKACIEMLKDKFGVSDFSKPAYIIVGTGNAGALFAREISKYENAKLFLVDRLDKSELAAQLHARYYNDALSIPPELFAENDTVVVVDATSHNDKRGGLAPSLDFVRRYDSEKNIIFIDYSMYVTEESYAPFHLKAHIGIGQEYVAYTNYIMVTWITKLANERGAAIPTPSYAEFLRKVKRSEERISG
jgi:hypothetical protein